MYAAFMVVGWLASRKAGDGTAADLIVAGRQMPLWVAALTMTATWVDGGYLLGTAEATYKSSVQLGIQGGVCFGISVIVGMNLVTAIVLSAVVITAYTMLGGMWSVAYTDVFQLGLVAIGLAAALP